MNWLICVIFYSYLQEHKRCVCKTKMPPGIYAIHRTAVQNYHGKFSKISNTFLFLFSNKMLLIRTEIYKMLVRIANREDPDQTASSEAV